MLRPLAILTPDYQWAINWLRTTYGDDIVEFNQSTMTAIVTMHNVDRPVRIFHCDVPERLRGCEIIGFEVVGGVPDSFIHLAKLMVRY